MDDATADEDPIVSAVRRSLSHSRRGADGVSLMSRFTIPEGDRREASPAMNALQICHLVHWATEEDLHFWIIVAHYPDHFSPCSLRCISSACRAAIGALGECRWVASRTIGSRSLGSSGAIVLRGCRPCYLPGPLTTSEVLGIIVVEAPACFLAKPSLLDVSAEQCAGPFR